MSPGGGETDGWQRLHPLSIVVKLGRSSLPLVVILLVGVASSPHDRSAVYTRLVVIALVGLVGLVYWLVTRWRVSGGVLQIETGLLRRSSLRYPLTQLQSVDVVRSGTARVLGMAELRLRMASGRESTGRLAYLRAGEAEALRSRLLALAHGLEADRPPPPERLIYRVDTAQLLASLAASGSFVVLAVGVVGFGLVSLVAPPLAAAGFGTSLTVLVGAAGGLWRRLNAGYGLTVAEAPDGLRVQSGLVERSAETIPQGRVQALRMVRPLTWRPFGWCRVEVDVAGKVTTSHRSRSERRAGRTLLPVGNVQQAGWLVGRVMPDAPSERMRPPPRARWKAPLRYRNLSFGADHRYVVVTSGRLRQVTDWVPLAKVQSIRRSEGPLQRRLGLASVHLDTAGRSVHAVARDRDAAEADAIVEWLAAASRQARQAEWGLGSGRPRA